MLAQSFDRMARELRQIEQMRQDFVSNVSHEMQSPLMSITGFAKALRDGIVAGEHRERYLDIIATESERLSRLSDNLLHLASLDSEHHPFVPQKFALDEQIRKVFKADRSRNRSKTGSGLGLSIVKKIIDLHGGEIRVNSTPGEGTSIEIILAESVHSVHLQSPAAASHLPM